MSCRFLIGSNLIKKWLAICQVCKTFLIYKFIDKIVIKSYHIYMKKFWKYFTIVILSLIGLCAIGLLYLFIVPNSSLFGICYISYNKNFSSNIFNTEENAINQIVLNSNNYDIEFATSTDNSVYVKVFANSFGYVLKKNSQVNINTSLLSGKLVINIIEPTGACVQNNSKIKVYLPANYEVNLMIDNNNAETVIDNEDLVFSALSGKTNNGKINILKCKINGSISANVNRGNFTIGANVQLANNNVEFNSNTGNFYGEKSTFGEFVVKSNNRAMIKIDQCAKFTLKKQSAGGSVKINNVGEVEVVSSDTNLDFGTVVTGASITLNKSGKVDIAKIQALATIQTYDGNIVITEATSALSLTTKHNGNIIVKNTQSSVLAETVYGDISVYFDAEAESFKDNPNSRKIQATTVDGKIIVSGVENVSVDITGKGSASIYMSNVIGENHVKAGKGNAYIEFSNDAAFTLNTTAKTGKFNINYLTLSNVGQSNHEFTGTNNFNINTSAPNGNTMLAETTSGFIKIRDIATKNY